MTATATARLPRIKPLTTSHRKVLAFIASQPNGMTDDELRSALGQRSAYSTIAGIRKDLSDMGMLIHNGVIRMSACLRPAKVWEHPTPVNLEEQF